MPSLYINSPKTEIRLEKRHLHIGQVSSDEKESPLVRRIPLFEIDRMIVIGANRVGSPLIRNFLDRDVPVFFLKRNGKYQGGFAPYRERDILLRIKQFQRHHDPDWTLRGAKLLTHAKLRNARRVLQKVSASRPDLDEEKKRCLHKVIGRLHRMSLKVVQAGTHDEVRGCEGLGSACYFRGFQALVPEPFHFGNRNRRPPTDPVNALLSLSYAMLVHEMRAEVICGGLESGLGLLHQPAHGRPALALDLIEPYRAPVADMLVLRLLGLKIFTPDDFQSDPETGGTRLTEDALHKYFRQYEQRMERWFKTRKGENHTTIRGLMRDSVLDLKRALRADADIRPYLMP